MVAPALVAQAPGSSSSSSSTPESQAVDTTPVPRIAQPEAGGSAFTLETSEPLFTLAAALNACGYDAGLADSDPVRLKVREQMNQELAASAPARDARDAVCFFLRQHALSDTGRDVAQYISLSLYLTPAPELAPSVDLTDLPPEAAPVVEILPLLRAFAEAVHLNAIWFEDRPEYEALIEGVHDPLTKMVLDTNIFLRLPVSTYDGRRFLVLLEPMLAPEETNARYNGVDSVVVVSPRAGTPETVPIDLIRHTYLHFLIEPLVYTRTSSINRLLPLLKPVQKAPLEFTYKSDIVALVTECLIKAVEAQTMDVGIPLPAKPGSLRERADQERYDAQMSVYDRQAEVVRRRRVDLEMRQGWVLVDYFYNQLGLMQKAGTSIKDNMGPMVYGMDVERERSHDEKIAFLPDGLRRRRDSPRAAPADRPGPGREQADEGRPRRRRRDRRCRAEGQPRERPGALPAGAHRPDAGRAGRGARPPDADREAVARPAHRRVGAHLPGADVRHRADAAARQGAGRVSRRAGQPRQPARHQGRRRGRHQTALRPAQTHGDLLRPGRQRRAPGPHRQGREGSLPPHPIQVGPAEPRHPADNSGKLKFERPLN